MIDFDLCGSFTPNPRNHICVYADEVKPITGFRWFLVGYLLIPSQAKEKAFCQLHTIRNSINYHKEIHFHQLTNHSQSLHGGKTAVAKRWLELFAEDDTKTWHFHLMGINLDKLQTSAFGKDRQEDTIYNRFFRSGLKYALKHCFDLPIHIDLLCHHETHMARDPYFSWHAINCLDKSDPYISYESQQIKFVASNHEDERCQDRISAEFLQMTDVLLGSFKQCYFATSEKGGKMELGQVVLPILERLSNPKSRHNQNSHFHYHRRISVGFFPSKRLDSQQVQDELARASSQFYIYQPLLIQDLYQPSLF